MKIEQNVNGFVIGGIFSLASLLSIITFIIPIFSVLPGGFIESVFREIYPNGANSKIGYATIIALFVILIVSLIIIFISSRRNILSNKNVFAIMVFEYFIVHTLGFYIYWAKVLNFRSDGQLAFAALSSFPSSSFALFFIGVFIDVVKKKPS